MLKDNALNFVRLGERMQDTSLLWSVDEFCETIGGERRLNGGGRKRLQARLEDLSQLADRLNLRVAGRIIARRLRKPENLPKSEDAYDAIVEVLKDDLKEKLFLFVPQERAAFWEKDNLLTDKAKAAFPNSAAELRGAGNAYAAGLAEGSIFYAMRALEHGLRALAADVGLTFDVQNWQNIISEIEAQIEGWRKNGIPGLAKADKGERLQFLSEAAKEFAYFKDGWRNYVVHAKVPYTENQAHTVLGHVTDFIERLSDRLAE